jgi:hypothetical protein
MTLMFVEGANLALENGVDVRWICRISTMLQQVKDSVYLVYLCIKYLDESNARLSYTRREVFAGLMVQQVRRIQSLADND